MKLRINTKHLHKILSILLKGVSTKVPVPILENFLIEVNNGSLRIMSFDNEVAISAEVETLEIQGNGSFAVPAKILASLISAMQEGEIEFNYNTGDTFITCSWESGNSTMPVFDSNDFPRPKKLSDTVEMANFSQAFLKDALTRTTQATGQLGESKPMLSGVVFELRKDGTTLVASDTKVMVCVESPVTGDARFTLPQKASNILKNLLEKNHDVELRTDGTVAEFKVGSYTVSSLLILQKYPNWANIIPTSNPNVLIVKRKDFAAAVKRIMVCTNAASKTLQVKLTYNEMQIIGQDLGYNITAQETMTCEYDGNDINVGFRAPSLLLLLENMLCEDVEISFKSPKNAVLIKPYGEQYKDEPVKSVIMPMVVG